MPASIRGCWEWMNCPSHLRESCPAFPRFGYICWLVPGTMCGGCRQPRVPDKLPMCRECSWYVEMLRLDREALKPAEARE